MLAVLFIGRYFYRVTTSISLEEQIISGNTAMGVTKAGFLAGLAIASTGGIWTVPDVQTKSLMIGIIGIGSMILLRLSLVINDRRQKDCLLEKTGSQTNRKEEYASPRIPSRNMARSCSRREFDYL